ncbi:uncharacterized protein BDCG_06341 [Blastomyces dermatitidis ER-3]|uniref:Uncharacterized protein n=2 Tax=Ajellomyces dermatitidis TaxID=5039 RepID=F2TH54_AJEDA|nr:uncharacterized protein BDCG_06341 [Blastomyces dermatitidis ER-3]EEQ91221.2 hypothetical protein BDCG_06341 [Blastomyces dermatitidis ER-3]EGE82567.2 hypothetical protein BDDG_05511 [Blastomyces dermatitidis ATCC 18188]EQL28572.1 hypothetical protein BDFG_08706 [Blastomyces dermatitidis ATCC 26199]
MSRLFSGSLQTLVRWSGFDKSKLSAKWKTAVENFTKPGGGAENRLGKLNSVNIKHRDDNPVHKSHFNRDDNEWVISAEISGANGRKVCHIYEDGTGTTKKGEERR